MSWVAAAVEKNRAQQSEKLHQTVSGGYGTKANIFWAVDPVDIPDSLRENVEETVKDDTSGINTCAIIRLETLPAFEDEELELSGSPVACLSVYVGTNGSDVEFERQINIYGDKKLATPLDDHFAAVPWDEMEGSAVSKRFRRMSVSLGWTEPPPMVRRESIAGTRSMPTSPIRAATARHMSLAMPDQHYRTEAASKRFTRKFSLGSAWMSSQKPILDTHEDQQVSVAASLAALEGPPATPTSPMMKVPDLAPSEPAKVPTARAAKRMTLREKRASLNEQVPEMITIKPPGAHVNVDQDAGSPSARHDTPMMDTFPSPTKEPPIPEQPDFTARRAKRQTAKRMSVFAVEDIPEGMEMPTINFQNTPSHVDPTALNDALAALEGNGAPMQETHLAETAPEATPRRLKRMSAKRVSLFLQEDIPELGEPEATAAADQAPEVPLKSPSREASVAYVLAALEEPTPPQPEAAVTRRTARHDKAARSRKTMSMYLENSPALLSPSTDMRDQRSYFETDPPETEFERTSRKLKRMSWSVVGRALPQLRQPNEPTPRHPKHVSWYPQHTASEPSPKDQPTLHAQAPPAAPHKTNPSSWYSMDPSVAELQCSPRKELGLPAPWLEPTAIAEPTSTKRTSWYPKAARKTAPLPAGEEAPGSPLREEMMTPAAVAREESAEERRRRKHANRLSRFVFPQPPTHTVPAVQRVASGGEDGGPLSSNPAKPVVPSSSWPGTPGTPGRRADMSRMRRFGVRVGKLFR